MKSNFLKISNSKILTKKQLKTIGGGTVYYCHCAGSPGSWYGNYPSGVEAGIAVAYYCSGGGTCDRTGGGGGGGAHEDIMRT